MLIRISTFDEIKKLTGKEGATPTQKIIMCNSCQNTIAFWAGFKKDTTFFFRPIMSHTQIVCGIHPLFARTKNEFNFEKLFIFGLECCGFNTLKKLADEFIPEITDLGEKIVLRCNPEPEEGGGYFITLREILMVSKNKPSEDPKKAPDLCKEDFKTNRQMFLQTNQERFYQILNFLKTFNKN